MIDLEARRIEQWLTTDAFPTATVISDPIDRGYAWTIVPNTSERLGLAVSTGVLQGYETPDIIEFLERNDWRALARGGVAFVLVDANGRLRISNTAVM